MPVSSPLSDNDESDIIPSLLNGMNGRLQGEALCGLLTKTLATLEKDYSELKSLLNAEQWKEAGDKAHQLKGSAYMFECSEVLFFLERISEENAALVGTDTFKNNFWSRAQGCLERLRQAVDDVS